MNARSRLTARKRNITSSSVTPAMTYRPLRAASSVRVIVPRICRNSSCSRASRVATMVRMPSGGLPRATAEGGVRRLVGGAAPLLDTGDDDRRPLGDQRHELLDERQLGRVVAHLVAQRGQQIRSTAPSALELLDERFVAGDDKTAARGFHVVDGRDQAVEVVGRFGILRGRLGQLPDPVETCRPDPERSDGIRDHEHQDRVRWQERRDAKSHGVDRFAADLAADRASLSDRRRE